MYRLGNNPISLTGQDEMYNKLRNVYLYYWRSDFTLSKTVNISFSLERFVECFIAEQNMVGVGIGCATRGRTIAFASTFACFLSRAYDQIRMGAISQTKVKLVGSHVGVSIGT